MSIDPKLFELQSTANVAAGLDEETVDFVMNLEVLNRCAHHCPGCFVNRRNSLGNVDLSEALKLARAMIDKGLRFREVIISPTDIFSADNSLDVLENKDFQELMRLHPKTRITTTAMFDEMNWENFLEVMEALDGPAYRSNMILELLVPMNVEKVMNRDQQYYDNFKRAVDYLTTQTPKEVDWSFVVNVHHDPQMFRHFDELTEIARDDFNTIIEFLPSFFRTGSDRFIRQHLDIWREFLRQVVTPENYKKIMLTIADKQHNASNTIVVNNRKDGMYISPFIYEQIVFDYPELKVEGTDAGWMDADDVIRKVGELQRQQYAYVAKTTECGSCQYMNTCIGRNVLSFMEIKGITDCVYPKEILDLYHDADSRSKRITHCADNHEQPALREDERDSNETCRSA